jgi:proteasome lid subunit RPN8/RPN11
MGEVRGRIFRSTRYNIRQIAAIPVRREAMNNAMPLIITTALDAEMRAHAKRDYPNECCGFLIGKRGDEGVIVHEARPAENMREDSLRNRFEIDPEEYMRVDQKARESQLGIVGYYHSHPDAPAVPSEFDREHAWPVYCYIIISVLRGQPAEMNNWLLLDDHSGYTQDAVRIVNSEN